MTVAYRELSISYGAIIAGGTNREVRLTGKYTLSRGADEGSISFSILVISATAAGFIDVCRSVESNFRKPYQALSINLSGSPITTGSQGLSSYLDPKPEIEKSGESEDTARSRRYEVTIRFGMPADNVSTKGFRELQVDVSEEESGRRTMRLSGLVTAIGSRNARDQYETLIDGVATSAASANGIDDFELVREPRAESSRNGKTLEFDRVYRELIFTQGGGSSLDNPNIVEQQLTLTRALDAPGDSAGRVFGTGGGSSTTTTLRRLTRTRLDYSATTKGMTPQKVYDQIRDWLLRQLREATKGATALVLEQPGFGPLDDNKLTVSMEGLSITDGAMMTERSIRGVTLENSTDEVIYAHDGTRHGAYVYPAKGEVSRRIIEVTKWAEKQTYAKQRKRADEHFSDLKSTGTFDGESGRWTQPRIETDVKPLRIGVGKDIINGSEVTTTVESRFYAPAKSTPSGVTPPKGGRS